MKQTPSNKKLVSVIMPVFNGRHYLEAAIESIVGQTFQDFELIIVNDASTDNSWTTIKLYKKRYPRLIKAFRLEKNVGAFAASNFALKKAGGDFIALMDCDDIAHPQRLEKQVKFLLNHPQTIVLGTQVDLIDREGRIVGSKALPTSHNGIYRQFALVHPMVHPSCMINRGLLKDKNKIYENKFGVNDDYYTFFTLLKSGNFTNLEDKLLEYRIHSNNSSLQKLKSRFFNTLRIRFHIFLTGQYKFFLSDLLLILLQALIVLAVPDKFLFQAYLLFRNNIFLKLDILQSSAKLGTTSQQLTKAGAIIQQIP